MRLEFADGQWAELREHITHGQDKEIRRAVLRSRADPALRLDVTTLAVRAYVSAWEVRDVDGQAIDLAHEDAIERAPADIVDELVGQAAALYAPEPAATEAAT